AADATAEDTCGDASWTVEADVTEMCGETFTMVRTYTATDECGNTATDTQTLTVVDTTAPELSDLPADMSVPCEMIPDAEILTASDICDSDVPVVFSETGGTSCSDPIIRTWMAEDDCGNMTSHTQVITLIDTEAPEVLVPPDQTIECDESVPLPFYIVTDNCDTDPLVEIEELIIPGDCPQEYILERTYTATDNCGNSSSAIETIYVVDTTAPIIGVPIPVEVIKNCTDLGIDIMDLYDYLEGNLTPAEAVAIDQAIYDLFESCNLVPPASDNCSDPSVYPVDLLVAGFNSLKFPETGLFEVVWQAEDECGNISANTMTSSIKVVDNIAPQALCQDITVELGPDGYVIVDPSLVDNGSFDNCGPVFISLSEDSLTCDNLGNNLITMLVFDLGGNISTCSANITLENNNPSGLVCPEDLVIGTDKDQCVVFVETGLLVATPMDPCESMEIGHVVTFEDGSTSFGGADASGIFPIGTHVIDWSAIGEDGTEYNCSTTVTVYDDQEPTLLCQNVTASLNNFEVTVPAVAFVALATDNCIGELTVTINGQSTANFYCEDLGINYLNVEVTDEAGNVTVCSATVDIQDPLGNCPPQECEAPTDLESTILANSVKLTWTPPAGAEACQILGGIVGGTEVSIIKYAPDITQHFVPIGALDPSADYEWKVRCACFLDPLDVSDFSPYDYFNLGAPTTNEEGLEEAENDMQANKFLSFGDNTLSIYPNPNNGQFFLETDLKEYNIEIYDLNGKVIHSQSAINAQLYPIDMNTVERGFYFLRVFDNVNFDQRVKVIIE
ncbi:MAG: T9SS type A sorting domain-containing protein, partial [Flavobacteriales bacterium]|nr:T9SS type A sorting domain-containing protein [Flavobacteriales bacterium]